MASTMVKTIQLNADMKNFIQQFMEAIKGLQVECNKIEKPSIFETDLKDSKEVLDQLREIAEAKEKLEEIGAQGGNAWNKLIEKEKQLKEQEGIVDEEDEKRNMKHAGAKGFWSGLTKQISENRKMTKFDKWQKAGEGAWEKITAIGTAAFGKIKDFVMGIFKEAWSDMKQALNYDSSGKNFSEEAYNQQMEYGLSDSENYALTQTLKRLNMSKDEYEMGGYNDERAKLLREQLAYQKSNYEEMKKTGVLQKMADLQEQYQKAREDLKKTVIQFIAENGPAIMDALKGLLSFVTSTFKFVAKLYNFFATKDETQSAEEARLNSNNIIQSYMNTSNNVNNISIRNNLTNNNAATTTYSQLSEAGKQNGMIIQNAINNS